MELNANEIVKALKVCGEYTHGTTCNSCPYMHIELADNEICSNRLSQDALALIKQLTVENEAISERYVIQVVTAIELDKQVQRLTEENERLKLDVEVCGAELSRYTENIVQMAKQDRSDTVREMQTRLTQYIGTYTDKSFVYVSAMFKLVDQIAKELIGDE